MPHTAQHMLQAPNNWYSSVLWLVYENTQSVPGGGVRYLFNGTYDDFLKIELLGHHPPLPQIHHQKSIWVLFEFCQKHPITPFFCGKNYHVYFSKFQKTPAGL